MNKKLLALAFGLFAVGAAIVPAYACSNAPVRCFYDRVAKKTVCVKQCGGGLLLN